MIRTRYGALLTLVASASALAACGTSTSDPKSSKAEPRKERPAMRHVAERDLDLGGINARGTDVDDEIGDLDEGREIEAARIAERIVDPVTIDPRLQLLRGQNGSVASARAVSKFFLGFDGALVAKRVSAAASTRTQLTDPLYDGLDVSVLVLSYDSDAIAASVARAFGAQFAKAGTNVFDGEQEIVERTTIAGHPKAYASLYRAGPEDLDPSVTAVEAVGSTVTVLFVAGLPVRQLAQTKQVTARMLTAQVAALKGFQATSLGELEHLPVDTTGVARLTLSPGFGGRQPFVWGPRGALHQQEQAGQLEAAFRRAELDVAVDGNSSDVYRTGSTAQATRLVDDLAATTTKTQYKAVPGEVEGLPEARCFAAVDLELGPDTKYYCMVQYGRYIGVAPGVSVEGAQQRISAQYLVLQEELEDDKDAD